MTFSRYPLVSLQNVPAYLALLAAWVAAATAASVSLVHLSGGGLSLGEAAGWSFATVMAGMMIMFIASAVNLRRLRSGFVRLAAGERDPRIPRVWCPVLTMATRASLELATTIHQQAARDREGDPPHVAEDRGAVIWLPPGCATERAAELARAGGAEVLTNICPVFVTRRLQARKE